MVNRINIVELDAKLTKKLASIKHIERITSKKAAEMLGISLRTLRRLERQGLTPARDDARYYRREYVKAEFEVFAKAYQDAKAQRKQKEGGTQ